MLCNKYLTPTFLQIHSPQKSAMQFISSFQISARSDWLHPNLLFPLQDGRCLNFASLEEFQVFTAL